MVLSGIAVSEILLLKRLGFRVAVFSLPRRGHTFVTKMTSDWTHIGLFWQTPITFEKKYMFKPAGTTKSFDCFFSVGLLVD